MPRTKLIKSKNKASSRLSKNMNKRNTELSLIFNDFEQDVKNYLDVFDTRCKANMTAIEDQIFDILSVISPVTRSKTLAELRLEKSSILHGVSSFMSNVTKNSTFNTKKKKQTDEGYITATETSRSVSSDRSVSRATRTSQRGTTATNKRQSRSLSRTKLSKNVTIQAPHKDVSTPLEKRTLPPNSWNFVTPKVKANTPITLLRRPIHGEMAISMQGSPLFVNAGNTDHCANVNIPLMDGRVLSLQPNRGLRRSEIPNLDEETRAQLQTLRDNINKVVSMVSESCN